MVLVLLVTTRPLSPRFSSDPRAFSISVLPVLEPKTEPSETEDTSPAYGPRWSCNFPAMTPGELSPPNHLAESPAGFASKKLIITQIYNRNSDGEHRAYIDSINPAFLRVQ
jgi:hypothetical protein